MRPATLHMRRDSPGRMRRESARSVRRRSANSHEEHACRDDRRRTQLSSHAANHQRSPSFRPYAVNTAPDSRVRYDPTSEPRVFFQRPSVQETSIRLPPRTCASTSSRAPCRRADELLALPRGERAVASGGRRPHSLPRESPLLPSIEGSLPRSRVSGHVPRRGRDAGLASDDQWARTSETPSSFDCGRSHDQSQDTQAHRRPRPLLGTLRRRPRHLLGPGSRRHHERRERERRSEPADRHEQADRPAAEEDGRSPRAGTGGAKREAFARCGLRQRPGLLAGLRAVGRHRLLRPRTPRGFLANRRLDIQEQLALQRSRSVHHGRNLAGVRQRRPRRRSAP